MAASGPPSVTAVASASARRSAMRAARGGGSVGAASAISRARACAPAISSGISDASGMFFQYFFGISDCIAEVFSRAGLKMLRK